jgi:riboflavin synthase
MFTGLVEQIGTVRSVKRSGKDAEIEVAADLGGLQLGESIAVNGTCLTVTRDLGGAFTATASAETLSRTTLKDLNTGAGVHLERALRLEDRVGGHLVSGHVDGVGKTVSLNPLGDALRVTYQAPKELAPLIAPKGSISVDGVSLTVNGATGVQFDVVLVPFTREKTLLDKRKTGSPVNIEVDLLAKYVARLLGKPGVDGRQPGEGLTLELLAREGFL